MRIDRTTSPDWPSELNKDLFPQSVVMGALEIEATNIAP